MQTQDLKPRDIYLKRLISFQDTEPVKVVTGIRRCGKSSLLRLMRKHLLETGTEQNQIISMNFESMEYRDKKTNECFIPHVIEPSIGVERLFLAVMSSAYDEDEINGEKRIVLRLAEHLAPYRFCVSPLLKNKPELVAKAQEVYAKLREKYNNVTWDDSGNIGKRYRKQDEIGTPKCVVIDFDTLKDDTVTVRDRDTTEQVRVKIEEL